MKKLILSFAFLIALLTSCSSNDAEQTESSNARISAVKNEQNLEIQKMKYSMLTKAEKMSIWSEKLDYLIQNKNLTSNQLLLLKELKSDLDISYFDNNTNDKKEVFKTIYTSNFLKKAKKEFSSDYIYNAFYTISGKAIDGPDASCTCNAGAIFTCGIGVDCGASVCKLLVDGCGFMGLYECNGRCKL